MKTEELKKKLDQKKGVILRYDDKGHCYVSMPIGRIPYKQFQEWQSRCDTEFGGSRWSCLWNDYMRVKQYDLTVEVETMKQMVKEEENTEESEPSNDLGLLNGGKEE